MSNQHRLAVLGKQHQIGFPVTRLSTLVDVGRALINGYPSLDMIYRAAAFTSALAFGARQVVPPAVVLGTANLGVDEPVDRLMADDLAFAFLFESAGHLGRRPALCKPGEN